MGKLQNLVNRAGRKVYMHLGDREIAAKFLQDAEAEGFHFSDGVKPTEREGDDLYALFPDLTMCYVGFVGRLAYQAVSDPSICRADYGQLLRQEQMSGIPLTFFQTEMEKAFRTPEEAERERRAHRAEEIFEQAEDILQNIRDGLLDQARLGIFTVSDGQRAFSVRVQLPENCLKKAPGPDSTVVFVPSPDLGEILDRVRKLAEEDAIHVGDPCLMQDWTGETQDIRYRIPVGEAYSWTAGISGSIFLDGACQKS